MLAEHEDLMDLPETRDVNVPGREPGSLRGLALVDGPVIAISSEENVLCLPTDLTTSHQRSVLLHELAHVIHLVGLAGAQREEATIPFVHEVELAYASAMEAGLWTDT